MDVRVQSRRNDMKSDVVVHVWKSQAHEVAKFAADGFHVVFSSCWYLDHLHYGPHWIKYYQCYPCTLALRLLAFSASASFALLHLL